MTDMASSARTARNADAVRRMKALRAPRVTVGKWTHPNLFHLRFLSLREKRMKCEARA